MSPYEVAGNIVHHLFCPKGVLGEGGQGNAELGNTHAYPSKFGI